MQQAFIHESAVVSEKASVDPMAYIGENCIIGDYAKIGFGAVVEKYTTVGENTVISANAHVGGDPQDISYNGEETKLEIGRSCVVREFSTIHRGSSSGDRVTKIGDNCYIMSYGHIGHDCKIGDNVIITSYSGISGHVEVGDYAVISGFTAIHQFVRIGRLSMVGGMSKIVKDVPPYTLVDGNPARIKGLNIVGLKRRGISPGVISSLKKALSYYMDKKLLHREAVDKIHELEQNEELAEFERFLLESQRGVTRK